MISALIAFSLSLVLNLGLLRYAKQHHKALDHDLNGPQKFHSWPVPRVGGLGIFSGVCAGSLFFAFWGTNQDYRLDTILLLACSLPAIGAGLWEDLTKRVSPRSRLVATFLSGLLAATWLGAVIRATDTPGLDWLVSTTLGAYAFTLLVVAGTAHSINIIDGFNGLASMCVVIMLGALAYVAHQVDDQWVFSLAVVGMCSTVGFFIWNFPRGLIFLGDGGAYFLGYLFAELAILLLVRNPNTVSPLFPLLVCIYPVFETVFSAYRRSILKGTSPGMPDGMHLHSLIYRRVMRWAAPDEDLRILTHRNSMTSPFLWLLCMLSVIPALLFWNNSGLLAISLVTFLVTYLVLYWRIVRFRGPGRLLWRRAARVRHSNSKDRANSSEQ